jgi:hypothetical protein
VVKPIPTASKKVLGLGLFLFLAGMSRLQTKENGVGTEYYRVPGFLFCRPKRLPPPRHTHQQASVAPPPGFGGGHTRLRERGRGGGADSDEGTDNLVL